MLPLRLLKIRNPLLCLSFNRISRLRLELEHLGNPPSVSPYEVPLTSRQELVHPPLQTSRVRQVVELEDAPKCESDDTTTSYTKNANANRQVEHLDAIYKTLGQSFLDAKDQGGANEAWYLQKVVEQNQQRFIWRWLSWDSSTYRRAIRSMSGALYGSPSS